MNATFQNKKIMIEFEVGEINKDILSFLSLLETSSKSKISDKDIEQISEEINQSWWEKNKSRFINEDRH